MAYVKIHAIRFTPQKTLKYVLSERTSSSKKTVIDYALSKEKTIASSLNCSVQNAHEQFQTVREFFNKDKDRLMYHAIQNFGVKIDPVVANEIGKKLSEKLFDDYQVVITTHSDTAYTHNHIVINAVSFRNGKKFHCSDEFYEKFKQISDELCIEYGLPVISKTKVLGVLDQDKKNNEEQKFNNKTDYRNTVSFNKKEKKSKSVRDIIRYDIDQAIEKSNNFDHFLSLLKEIGYSAKYKKKNGSRLKYMAFKPSFSDRFFRDASLGLEYNRASIEKRIALCVEDRKKIIALDQYQNKKHDDDSSVNYESVFVQKTKKIEPIGSVDKYIFYRLSDMNEEIKKDKKIIISLETEKTGIFKIFSFYRPVSDEQQRKIESFQRKKRVAYYVDAINKNFELLHLIKKHDIRSAIDVSQKMTQYSEQKNEIEKKQKFVSEQINELSKSVLAYANFERAFKTLEKMEGDPACSHEKVLKQRETVQKMKDQFQDLIFSSDSLAVTEKIEKTIERLDQSAKNLSLHKSMIDKNVEDLKKVQNMLGVLQDHKKPDLKTFGDKIPEPTPEKPPEPPQKTVSKDYSEPNSWENFLARKAREKELEFQEKQKIKKQREQEIQKQQENQRHSEESRPRNDDWER